LETGLANAFERRFIGSSSTSDAAFGKPQLVEELWKVGRENLDENGIVALQEAIAKGIRPQADDKEGTKSGTPDCCSTKATTQG
jgi:hypothetical protein